MCHVPVVDRDFLGQGKKLSPRETRKCGFTSRYGPSLSGTSMMLGDRV